MGADDVVCKGGVMKALMPGHPTYLSMQRYEGGPNESIGQVGGEGQEPITRSGFIISPSSL